MTGAFIVRNNLNKDNDIFQAFGEFVFDIVSALHDISLYVHSMMEKVQVFIEPQVDYFAN